MESLFGIPMDSLMQVMLVLFLIITVAIGVLALRNRLLFKLGARNLPRRRAQTMLTVFGLALAHQLMGYLIKSEPGLQQVIPWTQLTLIVVGAYAASLLTTYLPARQASQVFPAEALRYE